MATRIGRVSLRTPNRIGYRRLPAESPSVNGPWWEHGYALDGRSLGATAQTVMDALEQEGRRYGAVYVEDDDSLIPAGYYRLETDDYEKPPGAPNKRPWTVLLRRKTRHPVTRQAEDDNVAGADAADLDADEGKRVDYPPGAAFVAVLDPRNVVGAEKVNLPTGKWGAILRCYAVSTVTVEVRWKLHASDGALLATGSTKTLGAADTWTELDLGDLTIPSANDGANWYSVEVRDPTNANDLRLDRLCIVPR
jgi:hypothetical protein